MWNLTLRNLAARKGRVVMTAIAIVLGIAFITATQILGDTASNSLTKSAGNFYEQTAIDVRGPSVGVQGLERRGPVPTELGEAIAGVDGIDEVVDLYLEPVIVVRDNGKVLPTPATAGVWFDNDAQPLTVVDGTAPASGDEVALTRSLADDTGHEVGDVVSLESAVGPTEATVTAIVEAESSSVAGAPALALGAGGGEKLLPAGFATELVAFGDEGATADVRALADELDAGIDVRSGTQAAQDAVSAAETDARALTIIFGVFGGLALFVGCFIIYNTFNILMVQRRQEMALLRAIGVRRRQVTRSALAEATAIGLVSGVLGAFAGVAIAFLGRPLLLGDIDGPTVVGASAIVSGIFTGVVVALSSAYVPVRRAARVPPIEALREAAIPSSSIPRLRTFVGLLIAAASAALLVVGLTSDVDSPVTYVGIASAFGLVALLVLAPAFAVLLVPVIGAPIRLLRGQVGALATQNARRQPLRTASTASALMIGVAIVAFALVVAASLRATVTSAVRDRVNAEYVVSPVAFGSTLSPDAIAATVDAAGSAGVSVSYTTNGDLDGSSTPMFAIDTSGGGADLWDLRTGDQSIETLGPNGILVDRRVAADKGWEIGDTVELSIVGGGSRTLTVAMTGETRALGADAIIDAADIDELDPNATADQVLIGEGVDREQLEAALAGFPNAEVNTPESLANTLNSIINLILSVLLGFLGLSVVIAFMGVANTLALSIHERTRELGILRAIALRRSHVRSAVRWEAAIIAVLGTVLGIALGAGFGVAVTVSLEDTGFLRLDVPWFQLAGVVVLAAAAGTLAAALPARRAAKLDILDAIHEL